MMKTIGKFWILPGLFSVLFLLLAGLSIAQTIPADEMIKKWAPAKTSGKARGSSKSESSSRVVSFGEKQLPFATSSARLMPQAEKQLHEAAAAMTAPRTSNMKFMIIGHADPRGSEQLNLALSEQRADAVKTFLVGLGIPIARLSAQGFGKKYATGSDEATWAMDRRVDVIPVDDFNTYLEALSKSKASSLFVDVAVFYKDPGGRLVRMTDGAQLNSGDKYRIFFKPKQDCHIRVFEVDSAGKVDQKFPDSREQSMQNPTRSAQEYWVPGFSDWLTLDEIKGEERIYVVATRDPSNRLDSLNTDVISRIKVAKRGVAGTSERKNTPPPGASESAPATMKDSDADNVNIFDAFEKSLQACLTSERFLTMFTFQHR